MRLKKAELLKKAESKKAEIEKFQNYHKSNENS